jgi:hypothetical protein
MPMIRAVEICVTAQAPDDKQAARASRFKEDSSLRCGQFLLPAREKVAFA